MSGLDGYSSEELQDELRRRKDRPPPVAFRCERCGEEGHYNGMFKPWRFEIAAEAWARRHAACPASFGGGGI